MNPLFFCPVRWGYQQLWGSPQSFCGDVVRFYPDTPFERPSFEKMGRVWKSVQTFVQTTYEKPSIFGDVQTMFKRPSLP